MGNADWNDGSDAFLYGLDINENPYKPGTDEYFDWNAGWLFEYDDSKGIN